MKLEYLYIDGYKGLKRLKLQFKGSRRGGLYPWIFSLAAMVQGKSSVLEAVGLIFYPYYAKWAAGIYF